MAAVILDYDGTVHDCAKIYVPAFRKGYKYLVDKGYMEYRCYPDEEIISYLGFSPKDMWEKFAPDLDKAIQDKVSIMVSDEMTWLAENGRSELYGGAEEALEKLVNDGHKLIFLSNCFHGYMELHRRVHDLNRFYSAFFCSEDFGYIPKTEIFEKIKHEYNEEFIIVGDRYLDLEIARINDLKSVGCTYGYCAEHELDRASICISDISELPMAINKLSQSNWRNFK